jgi:hypothetical protein
MDASAVMKRLLVIGSWLAAVAGALAEVRLPADSPFQVILDRNPFGLRDAPTNAVTVQTSAPPAQVNVNLSGITYTGGKKQAWMVIPAGGTRTNTTCFSLGEGDPEREGVLVEQIDVRRGIVHIRKNGVPATLDLFGWPARPHATGSQAYDSRNRQPGPRRAGCDGADRQQSGGSAADHSSSIDSYLSGTRDIIGPHD